jgi:transposase
MAEIEKKTKRYPTDLTDEEWARIEPFLPGAAKSGRPARTDLREVLNAIRYLARSGGGWRMLPKDFPPWPTVYWWFRRFVRRFLFQTIHDVALMLDRERVGREASPTGGVIDSQSVKAPEAKTRGYDAGKKIVGRKRHIAVDTDGRLLMVNLTTADISDSAGAQMILDSVRKRWPWLKHLFADSAYDRTKLMDKAAFLDFTIEIIKRSVSPTAAFDRPANHIGVPGRHWQNARTEFSSACTSGNPKAAAAALRPLYCRSSAAILWP